MWKWLKNYRAKQNHQQVFSDITSLSKILTTIQLSVHVQVRSFHANRDSLDFTFAMQDAEDTKTPSEKRKKEVGLYDRLPIEAYALLGEVEKSLQVNVSDLSKQISENLQNISQRHTGFHLSTDKIERITQAKEIRELQSKVNQQIKTLQSKSYRKASQMQRWKKNNPDSFQYYHAKRKWGFFSGLKRKFCGLYNPKYSLGRNPLNKLSSYVKSLKKIIMHRYSTENISAEKPAVELRGRQMKTRTFGPEKRQKRVRRAHGKSGGLRREEGKEIKLSEVKGIVMNAGAAGTPPDLQANGVTEPLTFG